MKQNHNGQQPFSPEDIPRIVSRYRASGLGLAQFAQEHGIPAGRLHYWVYERARATTCKRAKGPSPAPVFRELKVGSFLPGMARWGAEVSLPEGVTVRFDAGAAPTWIGAVVQALQRPC